MAAAAAELLDAATCKKAVAIAGRERARGLAAGLREAGVKTALFLLVDPADAAWSSPRCDWNPPAPAKTTAFAAGRPTPALDPPDPKARDTRWSEFDGAVVVP